MITPPHTDAQVTVEAAESAPGARGGIPTRGYRTAMVSFDGITDVTAATAVIYGAIGANGQPSPYKTITLPIDGSRHDELLDVRGWGAISAKVTALAGGAGKKVRRTIQFGEDKL